MFRFAAPWLLALLPVGLAATVLMARRRRRGDARLSLPGASARLQLARSSWTRLESMLPWSRGLVLVLLVLAMARPQSGASIENVTTDGVDIVVALDISGSMRAEDFQPRNRLAVARQTVKDFIDGRSADRLGLVVFASLAVTRCPLTLDHPMLHDFLDDLDFAPTEQSGTAIGLGLATAVNRLRASEAKSKVIVLVTDGRNNRGQIGPKAAAEAAWALSVKVYTIGVGSEGEVPIPVDFGPMGKRYAMQRVDLDEDLLREIAGTTGGRYFRALDAGELQGIFETIDGLEKTKIVSRERVIFSELFTFVLLPALGLLLLERVLVGSRLRRIP